jgi:hypothetical protein
VDFPTLKVFFADSPIARLFRRDNPAAILGFLHHAFVETPRAAVPEGQLVAMLRDYSEMISGLGEKAASDPAKTIEDWCSNGFGILSKYFDPNGDVMCEMTADAHRVVSWVHNLTTTEFVAAESKIKSLWRDIETMVERATTNPAVRLEQLQKQIDTLEAEAKRLRETGEMEVLTPSQVNQDFVRLVALMREIPGDFRTVEEKLQQVASSISTRMMEEDANRGELVRMALDADEQLRRSEQGQSFDGFWQFLVGEGQRQQFEDVVELLYGIEGLTEQNRDNPIFRTLFSLLLREGEKVIRSQQRLSGQLRRAMDLTVRTHRRALMQSLREAKRAALARRDEFAGNRRFIYINDDSTLSSFMTRPLYERPVKADLTVDLVEASNAGGRELLAQFGGMNPIRLEKLRENVRQMLKGRSLVTLHDIVERYPPQNGVIEIVAYVSIAAESPNNYIDPDYPEEVKLPWRNPPAVLRVPHTLIQEVK